MTSSVPTKSIEVGMMRTLFVALAGVFGQMGNVCFGRCTAEMRFVTLLLIFLSVWGFTFLVHAKTRVGPFGNVAALVAVQNLLAPCSSPDFTYKYYSHSYNSVVTNIMAFFIITTAIVVFAGKPA